jgi:hypothetical protein
LWRKYASMATTTPTITAIAIQKRYMSLEPLAAMR